MKTRWQIIVRGKVQGVWYRASTEKKAISLGLKGFVRNQKDNSVYIEAEGEETVLQELLDWCAEGPPLAKVTQVDHQEISLSDDKGFSIVR